MSELINEIKRYTSMVDNELPFFMKNIRLENADEQCSEEVAALVR